MKKLLLLIPVFLISALTAEVQAQIEIGASYEIRDQDPTSGFGLRVEKGFFERMPLIDLSMRLHFSYFSEDNSISTGSISVSQDLTTYDFGIAVLGGVPIGLIKPYVGLGLGSESFDVEYNTAFEDDSENNIYWNTFVGARLTIIPLIKPFVEYRYSNSQLSSPDLSDKANGRVMFGVYLSF